MGQKALLQEVATNRQNFNGKPFEHWERQAEELVMDGLVRAAMNTDAEHSLIGYLARQRLLDIANAVNPKLLSEVLEQRDRCLSGFASTVVEAVHGKTQ